VEAELLKEIAFFVTNYPVSHYVLIAATVVIYVLVEIRDVAFRDKVAAGCASVLFAVSVFDFDFIWQGTAPLTLLQRTFGTFLAYLVFPITNILVLVVLWKNLFGRRLVKAWAYSLLCLVQVLLSAFVRYAAH
jgi:hypothetical protein